MKSKPVLTSSQTLFTFFFLIFFFTLLNGYLQNLVADYRANTWLVLAGLIIEMFIVVRLARRWVAIKGEPLEVAGFMLVVVGVWGYFVIPALPTLLPPTLSSDAVRVYLQVLFSYPNGTLVSWYPAGGTFVTAMFAHWFDLPPLRILHPTAASFIALSAGAVYGMTCAGLPKTRLSKISALIAPALLFVPWSYFAGTLNWEQYFFAQVFAQYFTLAVVWYTVSYVESPHWIFAGLIGAALLGVVAAYPIFVALPLALFGLVVLARVLREKSLWRNRGVVLTLLGFVGLLMLAAAALQRGGILELLAGRISIESDVGAGGVAKPSLETLGGPIFLALAVIGVRLAWRSPAGKTILGLLVVWTLQLITLLASQPMLAISGYRIDKTFYLLVFPLAMLAALPIAFALERIVGRFKISTRVLLFGFIAMTVVLGALVFILRPPKPFSPLTEDEIQVARWAKEFYNETYQIAYLDSNPVTAYWLAFGIWRETLPNEWFQWIPAGRKLGPPTFDEWLADPAWHDRMLVRYVEEIPKPLRVVYRQGSSAIIDKDLPPDYGPKPPHRSDLNFGTTLTLIGYDLPRTTFQPGESIPLTTWTQSLYPPSATVAWRLELLDHAGQVVQRIERDPFNNKYPLQRWAPGKYARDVWVVPLARNLSPAWYDVRLALFRRSDGELIDVRPMYSAQPIAPVPAAQITRIKIPLAPPSPDELRAATSLQTRAGDFFALSHYTLTRSAGNVTLNLYWQSVAKASKDFTVFVHLVDASGKIVSQVDAQPRGGTYPTSLWDVGEIVKDELMLTMPADARAPFSIKIGMYEHPSLQRLAVGGSDHIVLRVPD